MANNTNLARQLYNSNRIYNLSRQGNKITASVQDGKEYKVSFKTDYTHRIYSGKCTCPKKYSCEHVLAVNMAINSNRKILYFYDDMPLDECYYALSSYYRTLSDSNINQKLIDELDKRIETIHNNKQNQVNKVLDLTVPLSNIHNQISKSHPGFENKLNPLLDELLNNEETAKAVFNGFLFNKMNFIETIYDEYFEKSMNCLSDTYVLDKLSDILNEIKSNMDDISTLYFNKALSAHEDLLTTLNRINNYEDDTISKCRKVIRLIDENRIKVATKIYNSISKKHPLNSKIKELLDSKKTTSNIKDNVSDDLTLLQYYYIVLSSYNMSETPYLFLDEVDKRTNNILNLKDNRATLIINLIEDFYKITNYPKEKSVDVIEHFKLALDKLLNDDKSIETILEWTSNNRKYSKYIEFDEYQQICKNIQSRKSKQKNTNTNLKLSTNQSKNNAKLDISIDEYTTSYKAHKQDDLAMKQGSSNTHDKGKSNKNDESEDELSLSQYYYIELTGYSMSQAPYMFLNEVDKRTNNIINQKNDNRALLIIDLIEDFNKIINYPKTKKVDVIEHFKLALDKLLDDKESVETILEWTTDNKKKNKYNEYNEYLQICKNIISRKSKQNNKDNNAKLFSNDINQSKENKIDTYNNRNYTSSQINKKMDLYIKLMTGKNHDNAIELYDDFKQICGDDWYKYKQPFFDKLSKMAVQDVYFKLLDYENEWLIQTKKVLDLKNGSAMYLYGKYKDMIHNNNSEMSYLLFMECLIKEIKNMKEPYKDIKRYLDYLKDFNINENIINDIVLSLKIEFYDNKKLVEILDKY
ncbi:MAG: hypothetical protein LUG60_07180 [Erysipelotrichaceae bacterium]|nr:hypothetical protein [Erysipelotrichaceae bacterium]